LPRDPTRWLRPLEPRQGPRALGTATLGWCSEGANRDVSTSVSAPPQNTNPVTDCKGLRPLPEDQEAEPPGGSQGGALTSCPDLGQLPRQQDHDRRLRRDTFAAAGEAQPLGRGGLD
jgi:hypothetical protein